jgi:hypothetical protein
MHLSNEESLSRMTASSTYALGEWQESEVIILRELQGAVASGQDDDSSDRIGEGNNQRNEREHHSKSALV